MRFETRDKSVEDARGDRKVLASHELDGSYCVDLFVRPDDTFGFEHFRRDVEDAGSWTPIGGYAEMRFDSERAAVGAACRAVA